MTAPLSTSHARPKIGLVTCVFLTAAITIGNGIYTSLGLQLLTISHAFTILALWGIGGLCALCGALSYAELASRLPHSGGEYYYLSKIYHPALGTMAGVITLFAGFVAPISLACMAFGQYLHSCFPSCSSLLASIALITLVTIAHLFNLSFSAFFQDLITGFKFLLIALFLYLGFRYASLSPHILLPTTSTWHELFQPSSGVALLFCFYAYSGWNSITYIADDVAASQRTIGWSLVIGTLVVTLTYLLLNIVFLLAAPLEELRGVIDVATVASTHLVGTTGGKMMALLIAGGLVAGVSGMTWIGPRMTQVMGQNLPALFWLSRTSSNNIPWRATLLQYGLVIIVLLTSSFKMLLVATQIPVLVCSLLGVLGIIVLRQRSKREKGSAPAHLQTQSQLTGQTPFLPLFPCPWYPLPPLLFAAISLAALLYTIISDFQESLWGIFLIVLGLALHPVFKTKFRK
ncbi:MAG: APC family permease [Verrucomicrobia bacterium]|nr:APC family permease [Verrucomicrobiota bacterium]